MKKRLTKYEILIRLNGIQALEILEKAITNGESFIDAIDATVALNTTTINKKQETKINPNPHKSIWIDPEVAIVMCPPVQSQPQDFIEVGDLLNEE